MRFAIRIDILRRQQRRAKQVGDRLRRVREDRVLSLPALAEACGVTKQTVSGWERGAALMHDEYIENAARKLRVDPEWLRAGKGKAPKVRKRKP